ncbi:DUF1134 domain-containing protein [Novosphingobium sp. PhB165]|uniref:DUF1134 domain-containing protein n=1 Tax=Novosphingobium sp. PhB165 TaxID=2485105 RepID=UPI001FB41747|nr:DUF1134 domain-containing protein [Novosphingobium sp. PhB165]
MRVAVSVAMMAAGLAAPLAPAMAQVTTVDPDAAIDSDIGRPPQNAAPVQQAPEQQPVEPQDNGMPVDQGQGRVAPPPAAAPIPPRSPSSSDTYHQDDLIGAAEGVFGKGAKGLAELIEGLLKKQGEPNGYIIGREAGGAFAVGLRYGSGTLFHKVEGEQPVYWTGPSLGFDAGANAGNAFVLVYNLYDSEDLYHRFGAGEGQAYLVGGFTVSYLRRGNVVLIPVRAGAGLRLGANIGYMKFSHKQNWLPF